MIIVLASAQFGFFGLVGSQIVHAEVISARKADMELMGAVEDQSFLGLEMLGNLKASDPPEDIIAEIDRYLMSLQERDSIPLDAWYEFYTPLGALWGEQIGRTYGWEWEKVWLDEHKGDFVYAIVSPNRSMVIFPFRYFIDCVESGKTVAVSQVYYALGENRRLLGFPEDSYTDILTNLAYLVMIESE